MRERDAQKKLQKKEEKAMRKFVIIDDCMFQSGISRTETLRKIFMNGRHWNIFVMLTIQYCMGLRLTLHCEAMQAMFLYVVKI